jgi:RNA polymerase sigma-70 factor (ECF subfamily)
MPAEMEPDAALMLRVKQGDTAAFEELVDKYKQPVTNLVGRMLGDFTEAEDVAQTVFVQVFPRRGSLQGDCALLHLAVHHRAESLLQRA